MSHRNEPARERRRRKLKDTLSLSSLPLDDKKRLQLTLQNHFGWMVLQKCQVGDGNIPRGPQVVQYHENPERSGPNYQKVTYVMYLKGKDNSLGKTEKEIQTTKTGSVGFYDGAKGPKIHQAVEDPIRKEVMVLKPVKEENDKVRPRDDSLTNGKKKRLIYDFLYKKKGSDEQIFRPIDSEVGPIGASNKPEEIPVAVENYTTDYVPDKKTPKAGRGRTTPKSWQLRAGAESAESEVFRYNLIGECYLKDELEQESKRKQNWTAEYNCRYDRSTSRGRAEGEVLWDSSSKTNEYLYVSRETLRNKSRTRR